MNLLPRVTALTRQRISREFDDRGSEACMVEIIKHLKQHNPEFLDMAVKCATDIGDPHRMLTGFGMFYWLLVAQSPVSTHAPTLNPLPRVTPEIRHELVRQIDEQGSEAFIMQAIEDLEQGNPELLQMAHSFASSSREFLDSIQGFALLYKSLISQSVSDRRHLH